MKTDISITIDTRRARKDGTYPVKLRVYSPLLQKAKMYSTGMNMTPKKFESVWQREKPRRIYQNDRDYLDTLRIRAVDAAKNIEPFMFEDFEKKLLRKKGDGKNLIFHYNEKIKELKSLGRFGTAEIYELSLKSVQNFIEKQKGTKPESIPFISITPLFLQKYEQFMLEQGRSETTIGIYLRDLRAIFNNAIRENEIAEDLYPFGKNKYEIPAGTAVKKALTKAQLKILYNSKPQTPQQEKAKDFWFFVFICNGINIKDIALLKYGDIKGNTIEFKRAKSRHTAKKRMKNIVVHVTDLSKSIIEKYGNKEKNADQFVFPIIDDDTPKDQHMPKIKNFTRKINLHIKLLAKANQLPEDISTYWARHSFATLAIRGGANMEFVQEAFGHQNITTTQNYFAGFEDEAKKKVVENLLKF